MRGVKTKEQTKWKRYAIFIFLLLLLLVLLNSVNKVYKKKKEAEKTLVHMQEQVIELENREKTLNQSLDRMSTREGIGFEMRKKLNVAEVGENVAIIVMEGNSTSTQKASTSAWQKFKNFFTNLFE